MWILLNFRNKANLVFSLVLPVIFVIIGLVVNKTSSNVTYDSKPTPISLQGLPSYARSKVYPSAVPGLLLNNSDGMWPSFFFMIINFNNEMIKWYLLKVTISKLLKQLPIDWRIGIFIWMISFRKKKFNWIVHVHYCM